MKKLFLSVALVTVTCGIIIAAPSPNAEYLGIDNCKMCHSTEHKGWLKTSHARAFDLLTNVDQQNNAECLPCHTTGFGKQTGFKDATATPGLTGVTCESCHGPGSEHKGDATKIIKTPSAAVCASCHQEQNIHPTGM